MRYIKYKCNNCDKVFVADSTRHRINYCPCGKTWTDLEETYVRLFGNLDFVEEFNPPYFDDEEEYMSALLGWLNDSDEFYIMFIFNNVLNIKKVRK